MLTGTNDDDGWAEYARKTLERESSPLYENQQPQVGRAKRLRHAKGWVDPRIGKPGAVPVEDEPPLEIFGI